MGFWFDFVKKITNSSVVSKDKHKIKTASEVLEKYSNEEVKENYLEKVKGYAEIEIDECKEKNETKINLLENKIKKDFSFDFDKEAMKKAIVYSEILGKPKAKAKRKRWG